MTDYRGRRRKPEDEYPPEGYPSAPPGPQYRPPDPDEATSWIDQGPLAYEDQSYEQPPRRTTTAGRTDALSAAG